jgi:hypothetical protein
LHGVVRQTPLASLDKRRLLVFHEIGKLPRPVVAEALVACLAAASRAHRIYCTVFFSQGARVMLFTGGPTTTGPGMIVGARSILVGRIGFPHGRAAFQASFIHTSVGMVSTSPEHKVATAMTDGPRHDRRCGEKGVEGVAGMADGAVPDRRCEGWAVYGWLA